MFSLLKQFLEVNVSLFSSIGKALADMKGSAQPSSSAAPSTTIPSTIAAPTEDVTPKPGLFDQVRESLKAIPPTQAEKQVAAEPTPAALTGTIDRGAAVSAVFDSLIKHEGAEGDKTGAAKTGKLGVTAALRQRLKIPANVPDEKVAEQYLGMIYDKMPDYMKEAPPVVVELLLDNAYNIGEGMLKYRGINAAAREGDWLGVARNLLDTASINGQASRGIAVRRAFHYNKVATAMGEEPIATVEQLGDGTLRYLNKDKGVIFQYKPKNGRHKSSAIGKLSAEIPETEQKVVQQEAPTIYRDDEGKAFQMVEGKLVAV